jgi:hypothetical protein
MREVVFIADAVNSMVLQSIHVLVGLVTAEILAFVRLVYDNSVLWGNNPWCILRILVLSRFTDSLRLWHLVDRHLWPFLGSPFFGAVYVEVVEGQSDGGRGEWLVGRLDRWRLRRWPLWAERVKQRFSSREGGGRERRSALRVGLDVELEIKNWVGPGKVLHNIKPGSALEFRNVRLLARPLERRGTITLVSVQFHYHPHILVKSGGMFVLVMSNKGVKVRKFDATTSKISENILFDVRQERTVGGSA